MWRRELIAGKQADVFEPASGGFNPRFGILFLHPLGLETLPGREPYTSYFEEHRLVCVCPHAQRSWWTDRVCPEFDPTTSAEQHLLRNVMPFFEAQWGLRARSVGVFGISMGGQGAIRLAFRHPLLFPVTAGIASAFDFQESYGQGTPLDEMYDSKEACRQDTALLYIRPDHFPPHISFCIDPADVKWYRGNDRLHEKLSAIGIPHTADLTTQAGGHSWQYFDRMATPTLQFVLDGLNTESRRLL